jgi:predicted PurR-regulated permease PerM
LTDFFSKHWRLIGLILGIIIFLWILYLLRTVILPFATGLVLAYLLMPLVVWLEERLPPRNKWPGFRRVISVLIAFVLIICVVGSFSYFIVTAVIDASLTLLERAPDVIRQSLENIQGWFSDIIAALPEEMQEEVNQQIVEGGAALGDTIRSSLMGAVTSIPATFGMIMGFAVLPFFLFYLLKDSEKLKRGLISAFGEGNAEHARNVFSLIEQVLGRYIRAQIMLGIVVAYFTFIGLHILDIPYKLALSLLAGFTEVIPIVGPWIGGSIAVIVTLAIVPDKAIWVAVLFVCVQLLENNLLVPKIQSAYLRIHPAVMIFLLVFGTYVAGFWGLLIIGPLTATLVAIFKYIRDQYRQSELLTASEPGESDNPLSAG